ncbi:MAG: NAD(P)H-dependent oxidoreductase [bacterium]|nr:NAD(P)H-dependent oxidoreductase [bacterium]
MNATAEKSWEAIVAQITRFLAADAYLISTPMWNFGIPYALKHYLDVIVQPKYLFRYTAQGPVGLALNKRMLVVSARGGDYSADSPYHACDFVEPYLRTVFEFVGISDLTFINAQPLDAGGPQVAESKLIAAEAQARAVAAQWCD